MEKPTFDPNKKYTWDAKDTFCFTGHEFGVILNSLRAILSTQEAARIMLASQANDIVELGLSRAVEEGIAKEVAEEAKPSNTL